VRVLVWNLFHGRSLPPSRHELIGDFAGRLAAWEWDAALLQEVPPWWPPLLAQPAGAQQRTVLTSRNAFLPLRRALARRRPELMKSNGGGSNAALVRGRIAEHTAIRLRTWPERRVAQLLRLGDGSALVNYHASSRAERAREELARLREHALAWARGGPLVLAGDFNLRSPALAADFDHVARRDVDHVFVCGYRASRPALLLEREAVVDGREVLLSDHVPIFVELGGLNRSRAA
jgi:endonuclease/exonuclease/phosphatase family metal-dependent hydrolase